MNKAAHYLQEHLSGEVIDNPRARSYFSTDASILKVTPSLIVYPRGENDVRKAARFAWQLAERGRVIPITARGAGTDQSGAAIGQGIVMVFPAHMNRLLELDGKSGSVTVEPGINYAKLQQALQTHGRFLPPYPSSAEYSTIGGAVGNNSAGEKSVRYGDTRQYVKGLRVVLCNGEVIETGRLSKRELNKKLGLTNFEGEIYRSLDNLLDENKQVINNRALHVSKNAAGYDLWDIKRKDGSFDLTPLIVGAQGTLGVVTEVVLKTVPYNPNTTLLAGFFDSLGVAEEVISELRKMPEQPSAIEAVDDNLLKFVTKHHPNLLKDALPETIPKLAVLIEFDDANDRLQKKGAKHAAKILQKYQVPVKTETEPEKQEKLWNLRHSAALIAAHTQNGASALPLIEDGIVPIDRFKQYIQAVTKLYEKYGLEMALWGHAGDANLHMQPFLDLSQVGDRQKVFRLLEEYYELVIGLGGSTTGEHSDGRLRAPYLEKLYGTELCTLFQKVKQIFDPYNLMNPGVKLGTKREDIKDLLRHEYDLDNLTHHLPKS